MSVALPCFRATKPKSLQGQKTGDRCEWEQKPRALARHPGSRLLFRSLPRLSPPPRALGTEGDAHEKPSLPFTSKEPALEMAHHLFQQKLPLAGGRQEEALEANEQSDSKVGMT